MMTETYLWLVLSDTTQASNVLAYRSSDYMPLFCRADMVDWLRVTAFEVRS